MEDDMDSGSGISPPTEISADIDPDLAAIYQRIADERGYHFSTFEWLARHDPDFDKVRLSMVEWTYTRKNGALPVKYRELIACAVLAFRTYPSLKVHLARALREGASVAEVVQALEMASVPGGMATLHYGLDRLIELEHEQPELFQTS
jgi:alkylhydroperoxidase/carboxymuconolactone decarboxylase family protein YurZ